MITDYPKIKCPMCGGNTWWYSTIEKGYGALPQWLCGVCHAPSSPAAVLKMRIIKGTWLLNQMRLAGPEDETYIEALGRLHQLGAELAKLDTTCLYIENAKKVKSCLEGSLECFTCPNEYWWEQELQDKLKERGE